MPANRLYFYNEVNLNQSLGDPKENKDSTNKTDKSISEQSVIIKEEPREIENSENNKEVENFIKDEIEFGEDGDNDDSDEKKFFFDDYKNSLDCYRRLPYTSAEDEEIIHFVFKGSNLYKTSSILLWKYLASKKKSPPRTYQSLKNRFLRNIKPNLLTVYRHLIPDEETMTKILAKFPELKKNNKNKSLNLPLRASLMFENEAHKNLESVTLNKIPLEQTTNDVEEPLETNTASFFQPNENNSKKVEFKNDIIVVTVNYKEENQNSTKKHSIYETYLKHKEKNKANLCPTCGGSGLLNVKTEEETEQSETTSNLAQTEKNETDSDKTPTKINESVCAEDSLGQKRRNTPKSPSLLVMSSENETNCSDDSDKGGNSSEEVNLKDTAKRNFRKSNSKTSGKVNRNIDFREDPTNSENEKNFCITRRSLRNDKKKMKK